MAWRSQLPILTVGALGAMTASLGLGYGLGNYTVSGINPLYGSSRVTQLAYTSTDPGVAAYDADAGFAFADQATGKGTPGD